MDDPRQYNLIIYNIIFLGSFAIFVQPLNLCFTDLAENQKIYLDVRSTFVEHFAIAFYQQPLNAIEKKYRFPNFVEFRRCGKPVLTRVKGMVEQQ